MLYVRSEDYRWRRCDAMRYNSKGLELRHSEGLRSRENEQKYKDESDQKKQTSQFRRRRERY